jgi:hypothetical protein
LRAELESLDSVKAEFKIKLDRSSITLIIPRRYWASEDMPTAFEVVFHSNGVDLDWGSDG